MPEADPQFVLGASPLTTPYALPANYPFANLYNPYFNGNLYNPYLNVLPTAAPIVAPAAVPATKVITPLAGPLVTPLAAPAAGHAVVAPLRPYTPYDCVTAAGCAVKTLKEHGLAKREATAEADAEATADPEAYYGFGGFSPYYGYNGFYGGYPYGFGAY